jgi:transposase
MVAALPRSPGPLAEEDCRRNRFDRPISSSLLANRHSSSAASLHRSCFEPRRSWPRSSVIDPFKPRITRLLDTHPYSAQQIFQRLREDGYQGGVTILRNYIRRIRPTKRPVYLKLHFSPGECAQVDWGCYRTVAVGNTRRKLSFFVMVLAFSRQMFVEFTVSQTMEHFLACHEHGFAAFGGVPSKIMVDNLKSAVLQRLAGAAPVFNPRYLDFARHHGFAIEACNVARGNEKGRVERGVGYVKKNFLQGLELTDFSTIHAAAQLWLDTVANVRIRGVGGAFAGTARAVTMAASRNI